MRLLIISAMPHYRRDGQIVGWGPTVQEIDHLAEIFDQIRHVAFLYTERAPDSSLPYSSDRVSLVPVPSSGGQGLRGKLGILRMSPRYLRTIRNELPGADVVHVRCPANISLLAILWLTFVRHPRTRWVKYAGNWRPDGRGAFSYTLQRWWLNADLHRGLVTVNGHWPAQPKHVHSFMNPCLTEQELRDANRLTAGKQLTDPIRLLYVGRIEGPKGVGRALEVLSGLQRQGLSATLDLIGDGPERQAWEERAKALGVSHRVTFHGWLPRPALAPLYARSHFLVFPASSSEGWPKVLGEAMAYRVVPIAGGISSIPQVLKQLGVGRTFRPDDVQGFTEAILCYVAHPARWEAETENGARSANVFSYATYMTAVRRLLGIHEQQAAPLEQR
jgi:glycosyltransferase involved in cell wall biosynthesis